MKHSVRVSRLHEKCIPLWIKIGEALNEVLETTTLQDLIDRKVG